jgi:hypothetical protein
MAMFGMNIEQVRQLAQLLGQKAEMITGDIIPTITSQLSGTEWEGPDAAQFRSDWEGNLSSMLTQVAQQLVDTQTRANRNADEQDSASNSN